MASYVEMKVVQLLNEAGVKANDRNVRKIMKMVEEMDRIHKFKHREHPKCLHSLGTYSVTLTETGHPPMRSDKYEGFSLSSSFCAKAAKKYNGRSETLVTVTKGDFELKLAVVITYETDCSDYKVQFRNINLDVQSSYTGINQDPLDKIIFETCCYFEEFARAANFTVGEYDIEKEVLKQLMPVPLSTKRARTD